MGLNIPNLILAEKLARVGVNVSVFDSSAEKMAKFKNGVIPDIVKQGLYISN